MEITYIAHSCFKIKTKNQTIVIDPYNPDFTGYKLPKMSPDILLITHAHDDHNFKEGTVEAKLVIESPGEYEKDDVYITGIKTFHDDKKGAERGINTIYTIEAEGITLLHLGDLGHTLEEATISELPSVDILFIPVGGTYTIDGETAAKVIASIEPGIVIPMHYQTANATKLSAELHKVDKFLEEMGVENATPQEVLKVSKKSDIPNDTEVIVLKSNF
jgi:L-ascorbate metabolism protein UlaG (beta-lactamase superfamily)